jgi:hypothetical protein
VLVWEGYVWRIQLPFALLTGAIALYDVWIAGFEISFKRLLFLSLVVAAGGYLTQIVGVSHGFWRYTGPFQSYFFVPFTFIFAAICLYGLTTTWFERLFRGLHDFKPRWPNLLLVGALFPSENVPKELSDFADTAEESYGFFNVLFAISSSPFVDKTFPPKPQTRLMRLLRPLGALMGIFSPYKRTNVSTGPSS